MWGPREVEQKEWLDRPGQPRELIAGNLADMERLLSVLGVGRRVWSYLRRFEARPGQPLRVLDLATGSGWLPRTLLGHARRERRDLEVMGIDRDAQVVELARGWTGGETAIRFERAELERLEVGPEPFDVVTCTMTLHHLGATRATGLFTAMDRLGTRGWIVCDLLRGPAAFGLAWLGARLVSTNPMSRHDGPLSVRRAFTLAELERVVRSSGVSGARIRRFSGICAAVWREQENRHLPSYRRPPR